MPSSAGSASGLRVTPCITAPARPRAAPTSSPITVRGTRSERTMRWSLLCGSNSLKASHTVCSGIALAPYASEHAVDGSEQGDGSDEPHRPGPRPRVDGRTSPHHTGDRYRHRFGFLLVVVSVLRCSECSATLTVSEKASQRTGRLAPCYECGRHGVLAAEVRTRRLRLRPSRRRPPRAVGRHPQLPVAQPSPGDAQGRPGDLLPLVDEPARGGRDLQDRQGGRARPDAVRSDRPSTTTRPPSPRTRAGTS